LCEDLGIEFPIVAFTHCKDVAAEVVNAGGLAVLGGAGHTPDEIEADIKWLRQRVGSKPFGIDLLIPASVPATANRENLEAQIPEADIARARGARGAWFEVEGFERPFEVSAASGGRVVALGGVVDPDTRTAPLVFELPNPDRSLRVGMFARVRVLTGESRTALAVPLSALVDDGGQEVVFVMLGGESFARRPVRLGVRDGEYVEVREGVREGERVVSRGAWQVHLAATGGAVPAHGHVH